jgi:glycosyltransferase involved in cell wall biosynthesis
MSQKITFIIPARNNKQYLQLAYNSIRNLKTTHDVLVLDDASTDGTAEWVKEQNDNDLYLYRNDGPERKGIARMFDTGVKMSKTEAFMAFHADMVVNEGFDEAILKHLEPGVVVSATRVEPDLHPPGPEKIRVTHLGTEVDEFSFEEWYEYARRMVSQYTDPYGVHKTTEGIFAPWCMYKEDFLKVGGHDLLFAPQSKEDSDIFNRFQLQGYRFIQSWEAFVYHFTCRGSRFSPTAGGATGQNSPEWIETTLKGMRNFYRKWGHAVLHDNFMKPIIPNKYDIGLYIDLSTVDLGYSVHLLEVLEPLVSVVYYSGLEKARDVYIDKESDRTLYNLQNRIVWVNGSITEEETLMHSVFITITKQASLDNIHKNISIISKILDGNNASALSSGMFWLVEGEISVAINKDETLYKEVPIQPLDEDYLYWNT